jgi:hypothetical protein
LPERCLEPCEVRVVQCSEVCPVCSVHVVEPVNEFVGDVFPKRNAVPTEDTLGSGAESMGGGLYAAPCATSQAAGYVDSRQQVGWALY